MKFNSRAPDAHHLLEWPTVSQSSALPSANTSAPKVRPNTIA